MSKPKKKEVSLVVSQLMKLGMSHEQIAVELRVSSMAVYRWSKGKSSPSWATYDTLLVILQKLKRKVKA